MKNNTYFHRHLREGVNNFKRNGWMTLTSISSLAFMLFLVGITCLLSLNLNYMTAKVEQNVEIHVYLKDTNTDELKMLSDHIQSFAHVSSIQFISKNEGLKSFMKTMGDEGTAFQTLKDDNPLNDELVVKTDQPKDIPSVAKKIKKLELVDKVEYAKNVFNHMMKSTKLARWSGVIFIVILTLIAVHLVTNTIKITVIAQKEEIQLRKLIGATNFFIRIPFLIEGSIIGVLGAFVASLLVVAAYYFVYSFIYSHIDIGLITMMAPLPLIPVSCSVLLFFGILIGIFGANSSLRRIIKV